MDQWLLIYLTIGLGMAISFILWGVDNEHFGPDSYPLEFAICASMIIIYPLWIVVAVVVNVKRVLIGRKRG